MNDSEFHPPKSVSDGLEFFASMTVCPSDIRKIRENLRLADSPTDALQNILLTPLFASRNSLRLVRDMAEEGRSIYFDSGGYHVQIGKLRYEELYMPLLQIYKNNQWASRYALPDHVPLSQDTVDIAERKVKDTISYSKLFFEEMPDNLKSRAMPVVQGRNFAQVDACLEAYIGMGVAWIGFGSFGTVGASSEVNVATNSAVELAKHVVDVAHRYGIKVHMFGLGVPALVAMLKGIKADSFDSASWLKAAGFGQVFLPFMRAYNISYRSSISELQKGITFSQFETWRDLTGHRCQFCESVERLQHHKMHRAAHNLLVIAESVAMANHGDHDRIAEIYRQGSRKYKGEFGKWLAAS